MTPAQGELRVNPRSPILRPPCCSRAPLMILGGHLEAYPFIGLVLAGSLCNYQCTCSVPETSDGQGGTHMPVTVCSGLLLDKLQF